MDRIGLQVLQGPGDPNGPIGQLHQLQRSQDLMRRTQLTEY
jgi:hypothetical protein